MKEKFLKIKSKNENLSSIMCFVKMVKDKKISDFDLRKNFDDLVERSDYQGTPKESIIRWMKKEIIKK